MFLPAALGMEAHPPTPSDSSASVVHGDARNPQAELFKRCVAPNSVDTHLETLIQDAIRATSKLQSYVGDRADVVLLGDAKKPDELASSKRLKKGEKRALIPLFAPMLETVFKTESAEAMQCSLEMSNALNIARDEYELEIRRQLVEHSTQNEDPHGVPKWIDG